MKPDHPIDALFANARSAGRRVFVPFLTAGDPDLEATKQALGAIDAACTRRGVPTILEIGFPFSDPIADGPTIQASYTRALDAGVKIDAILAALAEIGPAVSSPRVGMVSFTIAHRRGIDRFLASASDAGLSGLILPDLPLEETETVRNACEEKGLALIQLVAPTTPAPRADAIARASRGFVYCVSIAGITGERTALPAELAERIARLRAATDLPICVGFGISGPEQVAEVARSADGVIVGSAIVRRLAELGADRDIGPLEAFVDSLLDPLAEPTP